MKTRSDSNIIRVVLKVGLVSACSATAADFGSNTGLGGDAGNFYVSADAGVAIMQPLIAGGSVYGYNVGPRVDVSAGYNITKNIAVELQGGFAHNAFSSQNGIPFP